MPTISAASEPCAAQGRVQLPQGGALLQVGPYEKVGPACGKVFAAIDAQGYKPAGPIMEKYLDMNPEAVKPEERKTEINVPVEKK